MATEDTNCPGQGLLAFLQSRASPKDQAEQAIDEDNAANLEQILLDNASTITEMTSFRRDLEENLLHLAVKKRSTQCLRLLISKFHWRIDRQTSLKQDAVDIAAVQCYLPVYWEVLHQYREPWAQVRDRLTRSSPHFALVDYLVWPDKGSVEEFLRSYNHSNLLDMQPSPLYLLSDLTLSTPGLGATWTPPSDWLNSKHIESDFLDWWNQKRDAPLLSEFCRRGIWRHFATLAGVAGDSPSATNCRNNEPQEQLKPSDSSAPPTTTRQNYFAYVDRLPLPPFLKAFLCFRELWPVQPRHRTTPYRRRGPVRPLGPDVWPPFPFFPLYEDDQHLNPMP